MLPTEAGFVYHHLLDYYCQFIFNLSYFDSIVINGYQRLVYLELCQPLLQAMIIFLYSSYSHRSLEEVRVLCIPRFYYSLKISEALSNGYPFDFLESIALMEVTYFLQRPEIEVFL